MLILLILKLSIALMFTATLIALAMTYIYSRAARRNEWAEEAHRVSAYWAIGFTWAAIILVRVMVMVNGGVHNVRLFHVHLPFALVYFISIHIQIFATGTKYPRFHKWLGITALSAYAVAYVTGLFLLVYP